MAFKRNESIVLHLGVYCNWNCNWLKPPTEIWGSMNILLKYLVKFRVKQQFTQKKILAHPWILWGHWIVCLHNIWLTFIFTFSSRHPLRLQPPEMRHLPKTTGIQKLTLPTPKRGPQQGQGVIFTFIDLEFDPDPDTTAVATTAAAARRVGAGGVWLVRQDVQEQLQFEDSYVDPFGGQAFWVSW